MSLIVNLALILIYDRQINQYSSIIDQLLILSSLVRLSWKSADKGFQRRWSRIRWNFIRIVDQLINIDWYRYHRKSLPFFCSSLTTGPNLIKIGTVVAPGEADQIAKFQRAAFLCCWETAHESFVKQQKSVKQVKNWTFANGNQTNCIGVIFTLNSKIEIVLAKKGRFCHNYGVFFGVFANYFIDSEQRNKFAKDIKLTFAFSAQNYPCTVLFE